MIKVLIVDDQQIIKEGLKVIIEQDFEISVVGFACNGIDAFNKCSELLPDVVLMDIVMPSYDGVEGVRLIKEKYNNIKVVMLTTFNDDTNITKAINSGADGYMLKDIKSEELILTIKSVALGLSILHKSAYLNIVEQVKFKYKASKIEKNDIDIQLTDREIRIIKMVVDGKNNNEIALELFVTEGTLRNFISNLLKKLNLRDRIQLVVYAFKNNLV